MSDLHVEHVCAVVVTYRPELALLNDLLRAVRAQVGGVVVVDNTADSWSMGSDCTDAPIADDVELLRLRENAGLASAQNVGIDWARAHGFSHVLLLDQDSTPGEGMVLALFHALIQLREEGQPVAAVGPRFHDLREGRDAPFVQVCFPWSRKLWCLRPDQKIACDFLISSGSLIPLQVLDAVGPMGSGLFIDNVDLEWSFRARARGYTLHGVCAALMHHRLGDERRLLPFGLGQLVVHGPVRLYYMMRNRLRLYRMPHTPRVWVAQDVPRVLVKFFLFGVFIGPRARNMRFMLRGLWDGLRGREGACPIS